MLAGVFLLLGLFLAYLSFTEKAPDAGLSEGKLRACSPKPACVSTESGEIPGINLPASVTLEDSIAKISEAIESMGGKIIRAEDAYLWAEFQSRIFRFTDDLEVRIDAEARMIHVRSESRAGHHDFGVNRRRIETLRGKLESRAG